MLKKTISVGVGVVLLASPLLASAQTVNSSTEASLIAALTALIQVLEQELQMLIAAHSNTATSQNTQPTVTQNTQATTQTNTQETTATPSCSLTPSVASASPGQNITVSWTSQNAVSAFWLAGNTVNTNGSQTFQTDPNSSNYTWDQALVVQNSAGVQAKCSVYIPISGNLGGYATIDQSSLVAASQYPTLTGTVSGVSAPYVEIGLGGNNNTGFNPTITNGHWSGSAVVALQPGSYPVSVTSLANGAVLATGILTVSANPAPTCTITANVTSASPGQNITLTWTSQNAVSASWLAGNSVGTSGSQAFPTDPNSTNYTWTQALGVQNSAGVQSRCSISIPIAGAVVVQPSATINQNSLTNTSGTPTITGSAVNVSSIYVTVTGNGQAGASQGSVPVNNGQWSATIYAKAINALPSGTYSVSVYNGVNGPLLASGTLTVSQ